MDLSFSIMHVLKTRQSCWEMEDVYETVVSVTKPLEEGYFSWWIRAACASFKPE